MKPTPAKAERDAAAARFRAVVGMVASCLPPSQMSVLSAEVEALIENRRFTRTHLIILRRLFKKMVSEERVHHQVRRISVSASESNGDTALPL